MKAIPRRIQFGIVAAGYLAVFAVAAVVVGFRYLQYVNHPQDAATYGTMWGFGDWLLGLFLGGLFLVPTLLLVLVIRNSEPAYTRYSQVLLGLGATAPVCVGLFFIPAVGQTNNFLGSFCLYRLAASPIVILGMAGSRLLARFPRTKCLTSYPLLLEVGTIALVVAMTVL